MDTQCIEIAHKLWETAKEKTRHIIHLSHLVRHFISLLFSLSLYLLKTSFFLQIFTYRVLMKSRYVCTFHMAFRVNLTVDTALLRRSQIEWIEWKYQYYILSKINEGMRDSTWFDVIECVSNQEWQSLINNNPIQYNTINLRTYLFCIAEIINCCMINRSEIKMKSYREWSRACLRLF